LQELSLNTRVIATELQPNGGNMRRNSLFVGVITLLLLSLYSNAFAQQPVGSIEGTITDQTGAVVTNAQIKITEKATARQISANTNADGFFVVRALLPGLYSVRIESSGFSPAVFENVTVLVGQVANVSTSLQVGTTSTVVEVTTGTDVQVDISRQTVDGVIRAKEIEQLPLNARNFLDLARLEPGVSVMDGGDIDPTKANAYRAVGVSGRGGTGTRVQIDGIDVTDETVGTTTSNISNEAISEFQLSRSSFDMSTSLTSSGAVNIATRSGSNEYHGSGFLFWRDQRLSAKQAPSQDTNQPFDRKQLGARAGGPIIKDKLFIFGTLERFYQQENLQYDPADFQFFPQMVGNVGLPRDIRQASTRLDWNLSGAARLFYRFNHSWDRSSGGTGQSPFQTINWTNVHVAGVDYTRARTTHSIRFGYVNFNNNIASQEFAAFPFATSGGTPYSLGVGEYAIGPNGLAPQQTYQDNFQTKYDGSYVVSNHTFRYGGEVNRIILGGFANFAGPLTINGTFTADPGGTRDQIIARGADPQDPLEYPLTGFSTGPANGFFTIPASHGFPFGGNYNNRFAWYIGDSWKARRNLTLNFGTRWQYDTGYFNKEQEDGARRAAIIGAVHSPSLQAPKFPKNRFGPSFGFAWDPRGKGKTSIRGGFYLAYEMNIFNNTLFNEFALIPPGIGPDAYTQAGVFGPDGTPINVDGLHPDGDYSDLVDQPIKNVLPLIVRVHQALNAAYTNYNFDPSSGDTLFEVSQGNTFGGIFPGDFKIPYSMQFNIGFQQELWGGSVLSVDYVRNRGVGMPFFLRDYEFRRDAAFLNAAAARARVTTVLGGLSFDDWLAADPSRNITSFGLANDTIFPGKTSDLLRARIMTGGYSFYQALQVKWQGRTSKSLLAFKNANFQFSYAFGESLASCGAGRAEFTTGTCDNRNINNKAYFGSNPFDFRHNFSGGVTFDTPGGFRMSTIVTAVTNPPTRINVPALGGITGANAIFTTDLNGDGGTGTTPTADILPGVNLGQWGRDVNSVSQLNDIITQYNQNQAGRLTPAGQALVDAGIFTEDQLRRLNAVTPTIPLIPATNPNPFGSNPVNFDLRVTRPINIENAGFVKNLSIEPYFDAFNLFNRRGLSPYNGLGGGFGSLTFNYATAGRLDDLRDQRAFRFAPRILQFGFRVTF
jgi:Carboxypeptidase regulatory-like domain